MQRMTDQLTHLQVKQNVGMGRYVTGEAGWAGENLLADMADYVAGTVNID